MVDGEAAANYGFVAAKDLIGGADAGFEYLNVRSGLHLSATYLANIAAVKTFITRAGL